MDLLQELTDIDTLHESEEGAEVLIDALVSSSRWIISLPEQRVPVQRRGVGTAALCSRAHPGALGAPLTAAGTCAGEHGGDLSGMPEFG